MIDNSPIFCLMGPTASGKSALALRLAEHFPCEIISVDSAMIYRGMDIGTAKPTAQQLSQVPHHLVNICDPKEHYSVAEFYRQTQAAIQAICQRRRIPLLVGGTMMYFNALRQGMHALPSANLQIREQLQQQANQLGWDCLYQRLMQLDPVTAEQIKRSDRQRILRAWEIYSLTGHIPSRLKDTQPAYPPLKSVDLVLTPTRGITQLRKRIQLRFEEMLVAGWIEEVQQLYAAQKLDPQDPAMKMVGYRQIGQYLAGEISYAELRNLVPLVTGQLAKRQLTWLRKWSNAYWLDSEEPDLFAQVVRLIAVAIGRI